MLKIISIVSFIVTAFLLCSSPVWGEALNKPAFWQQAWGKPATSILYAGMATYHLNPNSRDDNWNNQTVALTHQGYFIGTLINSYDRRAYTAGIERYWPEHQIEKNFKGHTGYRLGLITGYDDKLAAFAESTPVVPFAQVIYDITFQDHFGFEFSWCAVVVSAGFFYQF